MCCGRKMGQIENIWWNLSLQQQGGNLPSAGSHEHHLVLQHLSLNAAFVQQGLLFMWCSISWYLDTSICFCCYFLLFLLKVRKGCFNIGIPNFMGRWLSLGEFYSATVSRCSLLSSCWGRRTVRLRKAGICRILYFIFIYFPYWSHH